MKLVIHSVGSWDHANLRSWHPDDPGAIAEELMVTIGPKGERGADTFTLRLATPRGLLGLPGNEGIIATRPLLVIHEYDFQVLWAWLSKTVASCERQTWADCVGELRLYFVWEFEGMGPAK